MKRILLLLLLFAIPTAGFDRALPGYQFAFPRDHFSHPTFQVEWWYYTGNVQTAEGRPFGFELTFFRLATETGSPPKLDSIWNVDHLYLAHLALSDVEAGRFHKAERLNRAGPGLAGVDAEQQRIWNGNWEVRWLEPGDPLGRQRMRAVAEGFALDLELAPSKPAVVHGTDGVSQKAAGPGRASHYISFTRFGVSGTITLEGTDHDVSGGAWMDHEFSTDGMSPEQVGWDWMSIHLDNDAELMLYRIRRRDGSADPHSSGTYIDAAGRARHLEWSEIVMEPGEIWQSPQTGGRYPIRWKVAVPTLQLELDCSPRFPAQEVFSSRRLSPTYWEGAATYKGRMADRPVTGVGYLEMTGYDKPIELGRTE